MGRGYFLAINGQQRGPVEFDRLAAAGLTPDTLVWREGMNEWVPAANLPELQGALYPAPPVPVQALSDPPHPVGYQDTPMTPADVNSKKVLAGVLGIVLGGWGVHRFILNDPAGGAVRILITICTCGMGWVIGLIEGIIYLTKSDGEFYDTYIVQRKGWF